MIPPDAQNPGTSAPELTVTPRARTWSLGARLAAWGFLGLFAASLLGFVAVELVRDRSGVEADPGRLTEQNWELPADVPTPELSDATQQWGLGELRLRKNVDKMAGGVATADVDRDGDLDAVVANGELVVLLWEEDRFERAPGTELTDALAVSAGDIDGDGWVDLLVARTTAEDTVIWGGPWVRSGADPDRTALVGGGPSSMLLAAELTGDDRIDVVRLGRGHGHGAPDVLWAADPSTARSFLAQELPGGSRLSLAGEIADVDGDGLLDVWITRDLGWERGGDSVLSRRGDPTGPWFDVAQDLGAAMEIDGMGVTLADLDDNGTLDAYLSDLGDNEMLLQRAGRYEGAQGSGAARIRPPGSATTVVSSSWASGAVDVNLDGRLDLVVANGGFPFQTVPNKVPNTTIAESDPPAVLLGIGSGRFVDVWPELDLDTSLVARGLSVADFDGDGDDDVLIADRDGRLTALRNDNEAPSLRVDASPGCPTIGTVVTVNSGERVATTLLGAHTYAGAHGPGVIVGTRGRSSNVSVTWPDGSEATATASASVTRGQMTVAC